MPDSRVLTIVTRSAAVFCLLLVLAGQNGLAQVGNAVVRGKILDRSSGDPVAGAMVLLQARVMTLSGPAGGFTIGELSPGSYELTVRRLGFVPARASLKVDDPEGQAELTVWLQPLPLRLPPVTVSGDEGSRVLRREGFYERRAFGFGHFLTREHIEERGTGQVRDLFQLIPGLFVGRGGGCPPTLFLDGVLIGGPAPGAALTTEFRRSDVLDLLESLLSVGEIEGIEVYSGPSQIPARFNVLSGCPGRAIVVWTR